MSKELKITKARTFELDPAKKYLVILPAHDFSQEDAASVNKQFERWGSDSCVVLSTDPEAIKIVETEAKQ